MKNKSLIDRINKIAKKLAKEYSEFNQTDIANAEMIISEFVKNIKDAIDEFKTKQIPALNRLQEKMDSVKKSLATGKIRTDQAERLLKNLLNKMETKQFYLDSDVPSAEDFKSYTSENERYIDGVMRSGKVKEAFECIAKIISRSHDLNKSLTDFQEHYLGKFGNGTYIRTVLGKQTANREIMKEFMRSAEKRLRTVNFMKKLSNITRSIMVDLVDAQGRIIAHTSITSAVVRDFAKAHDKLKYVEIKEDEIDVEHPGYHLNTPINSSIKKAGVLKNIFNFFRGLINKVKDTVNKAISAVNVFWINSKTADEQIEYVCDSIMLDIDEMKNVFDKMAKGM